MIEARKAMTEGRQAIVEARKSLASVERTLAGAEPLPLEASEALREMARAAQSFRTLADYLERHPEAVIRGKPGERK
jgi:paraquat-inducible protein B